MQTDFFEQLKSVGHGETLYDGQIMFTYNDDEHKYLVSRRVDDTWTTPEPKVGITTATKIINKEALITWAANAAAKSFREIMTADPTTLLSVAEAEAKKAPNQLSGKGKVAGSIGHLLVEALLKGKEVKLPSDPDRRAIAENIMMQHKAFEAEYQPETIHSEKPMYSLKHDFAGTDDRLCKIGGKTILIDYKTTNRSRYSPDGIYADNFAQIGGQILLVEEQLGIKVDDGWIVNFSKDEPDFAVRQLSEMKLTITEAKLYFLHCLGLYRMDQLFNWRVK